MRRRAGRKDRCRLLLRGRLFRCHVYVCGGEVFVVVGGGWGLIIKAKTGEKNVLITTSSSFEENLHRTYRTYLLRYHQCACLACHILPGLLYLCQTNVFIRR